MIAATTTDRRLIGEQASAIAATTSHQGHWHPVEYLVVCTQINEVAGHLRYLGAKAAEDAGQVADSAVEGSLSQHPGEELLPVLPDVTDKGILCLLYTSDAADDLLCVD